MTHNSVRRGRGTQSTEASSLHQRGLAHLSPGPSVRCTTMAFVATILVVMVATTVATKHIVCHPFQSQSLSTQVLVQFQEDMGNALFISHQLPAGGSVLLQVSKGKLGSESKVLCRGRGLWLGVRMLLLFSGALRALETSLMWWPSAFGLFAQRALGFE